MIRKLSVFACYKKVNGSVATGSCVLSCVDDLMMLESINAKSETKLFHCKLLFITLFKMIFTSIILKFKVFMYVTRVLGVLFSEVLLFSNKNACKSFKNLQAFKTYLLRGHHVSV